MVTGIVVAMLPLVLRSHDLDAERVRLQERQRELESMVDEINSLVVVVNDSAAVHNLDVARHRDDDRRLGSQFQEGYYERSEGG